MLERKYSIEEIEKANFSELVSIVREPNMCSGGIETLRVIIRESNLRHDARILEIGSNTGFSSIEFASTLPHAKVIGIDINEQSVAFANDKAQRNGITNVDFIQSDALTLPFEDNYFDLVFCSNVTSFINDKNSAIKEYTRVLKPNGILAAVPIFYREKPPLNVKAEVEKAINAEIKSFNKEYWEKYFTSFNLQSFYTKDYKYVQSTAKDIQDYIEMVMRQEHLNYVSEAEKISMKNRLKYFYELFDLNLTYCGFSIMLYKYKPINNEPILHKTISI